MFSVRAAADPVNPTVDVKQKQRTPVAENREVERIRTSQREPKNPDPAPFNSTKQKFINLNI